MTAKSERAPLPLAILASAAVYTSGILVRPLGQAATKKLTPYAFLTFRVALSAVGLAIFCFAKGRFTSLPVRKLGSVAFFSIVDLIFAKWFFFVGINEVSAVTSATCTAILPVLISFCWEAIRPGTTSATSPKATLGVVMATAGSVAVIQESLFADGGARGAQTSTAFGVGTTVLSVLLGTVAMLAKARIATDIDYYLFSAWASIIGGGILTICGMVMGWVGADEALVLASDTKVMVALLVYVLYTSCMYPLTLWCMANAGPTLFTLIKTMQPSTGALVAYFLFGENISAIQAIAVLMSCAGLAIYVKSKDDAQKPKKD